MTNPLAEISRRLMAAQLAIYRAEWDLEVEPAADKMAALKTMVTNQLTFHALCADSALDNLPANSGDALVDELRRLHAHAKGIDLQTVEMAAGAALQCLQGWHGARAANDYGAVREAHEAVIGLQRKMAAVKAANLSELYGRAVTPYEALIDAYDPGRKLSFIKQVFGEVEVVCQQILKRAKPVAPFHNGAIDEQKQADFCLKVMTNMGYDATPPRGRMGISTHPLCRRVGEREVWLTNRYDARDFTTAMMNIIHEGGHGRYYQNLPSALASDWLGGVAGETINEGMALLAEQVIGRSPQFCQWLAPRITQQLGVPCDADALHKDLTAVTRDPIRAEAREAIYPLHLLLRTDVEEQLIDKGMAPADLPAYWSAESYKLMGITPVNDLTGCLQDIHLFVGYIGYFPCYLLGFMAAAQLGAAMTRDHPLIAADWAAGDFNRTNAWLESRIYHNGRTLSPDALMQQASGETLNSAALIAHLQKRYGTA